MVELLASQGIADTGPSSYTARVCPASAARATVARQPSASRPVRSLLLAALAIAAVACGPPIHVRRVAPERVTAELARSVLNSRRPSLFTENVLYRWNLEREWKKHPEDVTDGDLIDALGAVIREIASRRHR